MDKEQLKKASSGCKADIESGLIVEKCGNEITKICIPGSRGKSGGMSVFGVGGEVGYSSPDIECYTIQEIRKKMKNR